MLMFAMKLPMMLGCLKMTYNGKLYEAVAIRSYCLSNLTKGI